MESNLKFVRVNDLVELQNYAQAWNELSQLLPHKSPLMSHAWLSVFFEECLNPGEAWSVILGFEGELLVGVLPLVVAKKRKFGIKVQELSLPFDDQTMSVDMLIRPGYEKTACAAMLDSAFKEFPKAQCIVFRRIDTQSNTYQEIKDMPSSVEDFCENGASISNTKPFAEFRQGLGKNFKSNLNRANNKIKKAESSSFIVNDPDLTPSEQLDLVIEIEKSGWKGQEGTAIACSENTKRFYQKLVNNLHKEGWLYCHFLKVDGEVLAGNLGVLFANSLLLWKLGYSEAHSKISPGGILMERLLMSIDGNTSVTRIDLMTNEDWYNNWNMEWRPFFHVNVYRKSIIGSYLKAMNLLKKIVKKIVKR